MTEPGFPSAVRWKREGEAPAEPELRKRLALAAQTSASSVESRELRPPFFNGLLTPDPRSDVVELTALDDLLSTLDCLLTTVF